IVVQPHERRRCDPWLATARQALGDEAAAAAWEDGRQMRLAEAIGYAQSPHELAAVTRPASAQPEHHQTREQLTPRQREVAALIAPNVWAVLQRRGHAMNRAPEHGHALRRGGRQRLPWLGLMAMSVSLAYAMTVAVAGGAPGSAESAADPPAAIVAAQAPVGA